MVLVDTSVWIEYLQHAGSGLAQYIEPLLRVKEVTMCGMVLAELRAGCRTRAQLRVLAEAMEPLPYIEADRDDWFRAGKLAAEAAGRGFALGLGDCFIAALALHRDCMLFTLDRDFGRIPGLKLFPTCVT